MMSAGRPNGSGTVLGIALVAFFGLNLSTAISITHYGSPDETVANSSAPERQKRLLPYVNFYVAKNDYDQASNAHREYLESPFVESNALPGTFTPMPKKIKIQYLRPVHDFGAIYDKLSYLKASRRPVLVEDYKHPRLHEERQQIAYDFPRKYRPVAHIPPTSIDYRYEPPNRPDPKPYGVKVLRKPVVIVRSKPIHENIIDTPVIFVRTKPNYSLPEATSAKYKQYHRETTSDRLTDDDTEALSSILKRLQESNAIPQTLTIENVDNSIRTLVKILERMKEQRRFANRPIVVADEENVPPRGTISHPEDTEDGGTPGKPGVDYPALSTIPPTGFSCKTQRYKGFFGDPDTHCQVWHYCDLNGGQASFLCPNGTIFSQVALTCDWWYNVKCSSTAQLYVLNERLYKYILPLTPKFPEDYSGPLVDRYLALKFKEMEEKMEKEKKGTTISAEDTKPEENGEEIIEQTTLYDT